jgi:CRISPR-associated protein Cst2
MSKIYEIAILGRITWNLHSLSNEGTVGNVTEPRTLVLADGTKTDGISGEMLKHVHANYLWQLISNKTELCNACQEFNPEKADANPAVRRTREPEKTIEEALKCFLCDLHGFLVQRPTVSRESTIEFGWAVGLPQIYRETHTHIRYSPRETFVSIEEEREPNNWENEKCSERNCQTQPDQSKLFKVNNKWYCEEHLPSRAAQMVYHRPTRSGVYGIISVFQPWRIGLNDVNLKPVNNINRINRYKLALEAYIAMFLRTEGAMTTTRLPHTEKFEGIIVYTLTNFPVPVISPLKDDYAQQIKGVANKIGAQIKEFNSLETFVNVIKELEGLEPWSG